MQKLDLEIFEILSKIDNLETETETTLRDLDLETQNSYLEFFKQLRTKNILLDCEKGKAKQKGFANHKQSRKRDRKIYTIAENQFKELALDFGLEFLHEFKVKARDRKDHIHNYKLDFYFPSSKINIEINPLFHKTYLLVNTRDRLRKRLLKKLGIKTYFVTAFTRPKQTTIDKQKARKLLRQISETAINRETLSYYLE